MVVQIILLDMNGFLKIVYKGERDGYENGGN
jgi:hypothetical protein